MGLSWQREGPPRTRRWNKALESSHGARGQLRLARRAWGHREPTRRERWVEPQGSTHRVPSEGPSRGANEGDLEGRSLCCFGSREGTIAKRTPSRGEGSERRGSAGKRRRGREARSGKSSGQGERTRSGKAAPGAHGAAASTRRRACSLQQAFTRPCERARRTRQEGQPGLMVTPPSPTRRPIEEAGFPASTDAANPAERWRAAHLRVSPRNGCHGALQREASASVGDGKPRASGASASERTARNVVAEAAAERARRCHRSPGSCGSSESTNQTGWGERQEGTASVVRRGGCRRGESLRRV